MKIIHRIFCVCLFTASCDVVLNFQLGGSLRLAQMLMILVCFAAMARIIQDGRILWPRGATPFAIWIFWQALCLPLSGTLSIAVQFYVLLLFTAAGYLAVVQVYGQSDMVPALMRAYLWSYIAVAAFGLLQFFGPLLFHLTVPLTQQWIVYGRVARINAFSYEPSYYATYMFLGWAMLFQLRLSDAEITRGRTMKWATIMVTASLILSTSKTAWLCVIVEIVARFAPVAWLRFRTALSQIRKGSLFLQIPSRRIVGYAVLGLMLAFGVVLGAVVLLPDPTVLLAGTGLAGTPQHSFNDRNNAMYATWDVVVDSPLIGRSMGGVPVAIGYLQGEEITTMAQAREHWGFPVLLDVFAASGLIGFIPFALFLWTNTFGAYRFAKDYWPSEEAKWLRALSRAMILEWVVLMGDQNLFRVYLWFHFSMVTLVMYYLEYGPATAKVRAAEPLPSFTLNETPNALGA